MNGTLPAGLLCAVAGIMLAFVPTRWALLGGMLLIVSASIAARASPVLLPSNLAFGGCWVSLLACAMCVYSPKPPLPALVIVFAANAGFWAGKVGASNEFRDVSLSIVAATIVLPAAWLTRRGYFIIPRVVTSWLLAVAMIAAVLPLAVPHPGYVPDHMQ